MTQQTLESMQATVERVNQIAVSARDMLEVKGFVNTFNGRPTLVDVSHHLQFDLRLPNPKTEAILLRYIGLIRTAENGIPGATWDDVGSRHMISDALLAGAAVTPLRYINNVICFNPQELLSAGLRDCAIEGTA